MSKRESYEARTEELLTPIADANHVEIYDVEYVKEGSDWYLRCYIDKEEGVSINDCEAVSRALSDELDRTDFIEDAYILEVSSPGLGRQLKKDKHLERSLLCQVDIKCYRPVYGAKDFTGILKAFDENTITLEVCDTPKTGGRGGKKNTPKDDALQDAARCGGALQEPAGTDMVFDRKDIAAVKLALDF